MSNSLKGWAINNKKVVTNLKVHFQRKDKGYHKYLFIIMSDAMEENIKKW